MIVARMRVAANGVIAGGRLSGAGVMGMVSIAKLPFREGVVSITQFILTF